MVLVFTSGLLDDIRSIPPDLTFIHYASGYQVRFWALIKFTATLGIVSTIAILIYRHRNAFRALRSRSTKQKPSDLRYIGLEASERQHRQWSL